MVLFEIDGEIPSFACNTSFSFYCRTDLRHPVKTAVQAYEDNIRQWQMRGNGIGLRIGYLDSPRPFADCAGARVPEGALFKSA